MSNNKIKHEVYIVNDDKSTEVVAIYDTLSEAEDFAWSYPHENIHINILHNE